MFQTTFAARRLARPFFAAATALSLFAAVGAPSPTAAAGTTGCLPVTTSAGERTGVLIVNGEPTGQRCTPSGSLPTLSLGSLSQLEAQRLRLVIQSLQPQAKHCIPVLVNGEPTGQCRPG